MLENLTGLRIGSIGGMLGSILGIGGGVFGTCCSIKNTRGPLEREFMIKASARSKKALHGK